MAKLVISSYSILLIFIIIIFLQSSNAAYNVVSYGAKPNGITDSTKPFLKAWSLACESAKPATIHVPQGRFLIGAVVFRGPCKSIIVFRIDGTLVAPSNYWNLGNSGYWILFSNVARVLLFGGTIDARGAGFWECLRTGRSCPVGARSLSFVGSTNIVVSNLTSINSQTMHVTIDQCTNLAIRNVKIKAPRDSPNTDGINIKSSKGVKIISSAITTGDDCISIGQGTKNLWIERIACGPGHGISIGSPADSLNEVGVQNVTVTNAIFTKTDNGVRIKSWSRPSDGYARNIVFRNIIINNVYNPIVIDQNYCPHNKDCPREGSGVKISEVKYKNIKGTSATRVAMHFNCSWINPCKGIKLEDINLTYKGKASTSYCGNADGSSSGVVIPSSCL